MELHPFTRVAVTGAALVLLAAPLAACGDDEAESGGSTSETPEETTTTEAVQEVDSETAALGTELCEAFGAVREPGGADAVMEMLSDDVVFTDVVLGADLTGKEQVEAYLLSDAFAGIDSAECGAMVARGAWGAGAYTLSNSVTGAGGSGIAAVHVSDGLVDRQVVHYTRNEADAPSPPEDTISSGVVFDYCHAWDDGADVEAVLSQMTAEPTLVVTEPITGTEGVRAFVDSFDFDQNDCAEVGVQHGEWAAMANGFANTTTGVAIEGVNVARIEGDKVASHYVYLDPAG